MHCPHLRPLSPGACPQVNIDNINLFSLITILSFFLLAPFTLLREGLQFNPDAMRALGIVDTQLLMRKAVVAGFCFHAYQQVWGRRTARRPDFCWVPAAVCTQYAGENGCLMGGCSLQTPSRAARSAGTCMLWWASLGLGGALS